MTVADRPSCQSDQSLDTGRGTPLYESVVLVLGPVLTGILLAYTFSPGLMSLLAWVALVPLALALRINRNWPEFYFGLYLGGLAFQLIHLDCVRSGMGATWLSGPRATQWIAQGVVLALTWVFAFAVGRVFLSRTRLPMAVSMPVMWVAFEFVRRYSWALVDGAGYPYGLLGLSQSQQSRLIQIADIGGVYAVSAMVAAANGALADVLFYFGTAGGRRKKRTTIRSALAVVVVLGIVYVYGIFKTTDMNTDTGPTVCIMPASTASMLRPPRVMPGGAAKTSAATKTLLDDTGPLTKKPDFVIWNEGAYPGSVESSRKSSSVARLEEVARQYNACLIVGCDRVAGDGDPRPFNSSAVIDSRHGYLGCYDKLRLVPFAEFSPPAVSAFRHRISDRYRRGEAYPVFSVEVGNPARVYKVATTICYDVGFPNLFRRFMYPSDNVPQPDFFVVPACETQDIHMRIQRLLLQLAQFRAIECRRAIVRNARGGYSGIIDGNGKLIASPDEIDFEKPTALGSVPLDSRFSLYARLGDWLPTLCCVLFVVGVIRPQRVSTSARLSAIWPKNACAEVAR